MAIKPSSNAQTFGLHWHCISALNVASDTDNSPIRCSDLSESREEWELHIGGPLGEPGNGKVGAILAFKFPGVYGLTLDFGKVPHI